MARLKLSPAKPRSLALVLRYLLVVGGVIGLICSFVISYDKLQLLEHPGFQPSCDLNPIVSCGNVMKSAQGSVFGFPNPWIGLVSFAVLLTIGMALFAGATFKRWFWLGVQLGTIFGTAFAYWLLFESIYRIHALCPYCLTVDIVVTTLFWYVTLYNLETGVIKVVTHLKPVVGFMRRHHVDILVGWHLVVITEILHHFWYYFGQHGL